MNSKARTSASIIGRCSRRILLAAALLTAGCAATPPLLQRPEKGGPQWPEAPLHARIQWVKSVSNPEEAGIAKGWWKRVLDAIAGAESRNFVKPYGVLFDEEGRLMVADAGLRAVHLMDTKGGRYLRITGPRETPLLTPIALAEDDRGALYITDSSANMVYRYDFAGGALSPFAKLQRPTGMAFNKVNKLLYVSETGAGRVVALDPAGVTRYSIGGSGSERFFNMPVDLAVDGRGQLLVNDPLNYAVKIFTAEGLPVGQFGRMGDSLGEMNKPKGIAVNGEGHVYVCDALHDAVQIFGQDGEFLFSFGTIGTADGSFWMPSGIHIHDNYIFVSDTFNHRIQVFRYFNSSRLDDDASEKQQMIGKR